MKDFNFALHLYDAITIGKLVITKHKTGDWLKSLTSDEFEHLTITIEQDTIAGHDIIVTLVSHLSVLETGTFVSYPLSELEHLVDRFIIIVRLEKLRRVGFVEFPKMPSLYDDDGQFRFTEKGLAVADYIKAIFAQ